MSDLLGSRYEFSCPQCGRKVSTTLRAVQSGRTVTCPGGHRIKLHEEGHGLRDADQSLKKFERSVKDLQRKLKRL